MPIAPGSRLGPYEITALIAAGGMGEVYRARDTRLNRDVAIKVLPQQLSSDVGLRERLHREARAISSLTHPNICTLYDIGEQDGADYLVMEYLQGETLADVVARGPLSLAEVTRYGIQIADAMAAAHRRGVVHRDLKPGNVIVTTSGIKVLDFGLAAPNVTTPAQSATIAKPLTQAGHVVGTLQYMSPEQLLGAPVDERSDIYSLGAILYEMRTGKRAFDGARRDLPPHVEPAALDALIRRCLAENPDARLHSARDVEFALQDIAGVKSSRMPATIVAAALIALVIIATIAFIVRRKPSAVNDSRPNTIAVLPFANLGVDRAHDYLRLAIPDEVTTILTYNPDLAVRPFSSSRLLEPNVEPQVAAKRLNAVAIVTGHVIDAQGRLDVTLEATDAPANKLLWRDTFDVPSADLVTMRRELGTRIETGLMPKLAGHAPVRPANAAKNAEAYALFLRAAAMENEGEANKQALQLLRQSVALDNSYADAWSAISLREYYDAAYGNGGPAARLRSAEAADRALELDPDLPQATTRKIVIQTEAGDTIGAYRGARRFVDRWPRSADAHFNLAYVLRYGGALEQSAAECNRALALDPGNRLFRSCAATFYYAGDLRRAQQVEQLDPESGLVRRLRRSEFIREHQLDEAIAGSDPNLPMSRLLKLAREKASPQALQAATEDVVMRAQQVDDGESYYGFAGILAAVGRIDGALTLLRGAIAKNFCVYPAIDHDPLYDNVRGAPGYAELHAKAVQCRDRFMAAMGQ